MLYRTACTALTGRNYSNIIDITSDHIFGIEVPYIYMMGKSTAESLNQNTIDTEVSAFESSSNLLRACRIPHKYSSYIQRTETDI